MFFSFLKADGGNLFWGNPQEVGTLTQVGDEIFYASAGIGQGIFMTLEDFRKRDFLKGDDAILFFTMQGTAGAPQPHTACCHGYYH